MYDCSQEIVCEGHVPVSRYVQETAVDCLWLLLSPVLRGRLHALDSADEVTDLAAFAKRFSVGQSLRCTVLQVPPLSSSSAPL